MRTSVREASLIAFVADLPAISSVKYQDIEFVVKYFFLGVETRL